MKKVTLILAALALVLGISQCKKQEEPAQNGEKQHIVLTASNGNDGSKVDAAVSGNLLDLTWEGNETITVTGGMDGTLYYKSGATTSTATFEGDVTKVSDNNIVFSLGQPDYMGQAGTLDGLKGLIHLQGTSPYREDGKYDVRMILQNAVLKLDLSAFAPAEGTTTVTINAGEDPVASVTGITSASKEVYVALPATSNYTFTGNGLIATRPNWALEANHFYTADNEGAAIPIEASPIPTPELLTGKFSVSATEYVQFSRGNLFCTDKGSNNYEFSFELNQYDYRCRSERTNDQASIGGTITVTPSSTSGLFEWIPRTSTSAAGDWGAFSEYTSPLSDGQTSDVLDFGGVFPASGWTTLTNAEWQYLLNNHTKKIVTVNGVKGLCIAPDAYVAEIADSYTSEQWNVAEEYGVVFLPYYGYYNPNGGLKEVYTHEAGYWSSTAITSVYGVEPQYCADALKFSNNGDHYTMEARWRIYAQNVRLVQRFEKPTMP